MSEGGPHGWKMTKEAVLSGVRGEVGRDPLDQRWGLLDQAQCYSHYKRKPLEHFKGKDKSLIYRTTNTLKQEFKVIFS